MDWIGKQLSSGDTSLKVKNLRLFQDHADKFLQKKYLLTLDQYRNPNLSEEIQTVKLLFIYYNIVLYSIEKCANPFFSGFTIQKFFNEELEIKKSILLKIAVYKAIHNMPFTLYWDSKKEFLHVQLIFSSEKDIQRVYMPRQNRQLMNEKEIAKEMEDLYEWAKQAMRKDSP